MNWNRKRRVRFGDNSEFVFEKPYSEEDVELIWYTGDEYSAIKSEVYAMTKAVSKQNSSQIIEEDPRWNWRGFEHIRQKRPRKEIRRRHMNDLLHFHRVLKVDDPIGLGLYASNNTRDCAKRARDLALLDQSEAFNIYKEASLIEKNDEDEMEDVPMMEMEDVPMMEMEEDLSESEHDSISGPASASSPAATLEPKIEPVSLSICRGDAFKATAPEGASSYLSMEEDPALSLLILPYKLALMLLPCAC
jgi:hypothetical protein